MKTFLKLAAVAVFLTLFGFTQQIQAQTLNVTNNTSCWIVVKGHAGNNCSPCNNTNINIGGTWVPPNGGSKNIQYPCPVTINGGNWIGIKYKKGSPPISTSPGPISLGGIAYSVNPFHPISLCPYTTSAVIGCSGAIIGASWSDSTNVIIE